MKIQNFILLGLTSGQSTNGDWQSSNGDIVNLHGNEIMIFGEDGSFSNGVVVINDDHGITSISFSDNTGKLTTGFMGDGGNSVIFPNHDVWNREG